MDADRFDALSRALTTAPTRRTTLGALLGTLVAAAFPGRSSDSLAASRKRHDRDVRAAACLPPGAKRCRRGSQCCSGRCNKKKKKCLPCATGTEYCAAKQACVDPAQYQTDHDNCGSCGHDCGTQICESGNCVDDPCPTGTCGTGTCTTNSDCCPTDRPGCASETSATYKFCDNGNCVCAGAARPDYPKECTFASDTSQCHECCNNADCVVKTSDPNRTCFFGNCVCGGDKPKLCFHKGAGGTGYCTDPRSDPENCSPFVEDCGFGCPPGQACISGTCTFQGGG